MKIEKLWSVEESWPDGVTGTIFLPLVSPCVAKEALSNTHAGEDEVTGAKPVHEEDKDAEKERRTLGVQVVRFKGPKMIQIGVF